jgi:hypothetical protein
MKDTRRTRTWTLAAVIALAATAGVASKRTLERREARVAAVPAAAGEELRDAVASPMTPATARLAGKPVPTSWFKTPQEQRAETDTALLSSRRRRAFARRAAAQ